MKQGQFPAILPLASLDGQIGFKLDGENIGDYSGSVSAAGDINGDGYADLIIGASYYPGGSGPGRSYTVFGGPGVGSSGVFNLSSLTGANGFKLDGENTGDYSGNSVSTAGDINGDGQDDLLIGSYGYPGGGVAMGRSYVVFGRSGVGSSGMFSLSSLTGANGFKLTGENSNDHSGFSVSAAGDINGDGHDDLIIGAWCYDLGSCKGRSYVVFGGSGVGSGGVLSLSSLNGANGFKVDGENNGDQSGSSVSAAGDINSDGHDDLIIGAIGYPGGSYKGCSYVVFGGLGVGSGGVVSLSSLTGINGFKLDGENNNDFSGSVSVAGDINGDGHDDLIIGAYGYPGGGYKGRSYVVFGGPGVGSGGVLSLSSLNGANGFKFDGENNGDYSGVSVSKAGDINGDGYADLIIGAFYYMGGGNKGHSYVVFGRPGIGSSGVFNLSSLNGANGFKLDGENDGDRSGNSVSAAGDINGDGLDDLIVGAYGYPKGNYTGRSYVVFGDVPPVLVNNSLSLFVGAAIQLNSIWLAAYDRNHNNNTLVFIPSGITHGQFEALGVPGIPLVNFTQQQITSGAIQFVHDGTLVAPSYNMTVRSSGIAWTGPLSAKITFSGTPPSYFPAVIPLASLNGQNGFKLDGENNGDYSGSSVSAAGDINSDGYADLIIGAYGYPGGSGQGRSYVVFGGSGVGSSGVFDLSSLNGINGFKLSGENTNDGSGNSVSMAGDINGDGHTDLLIGAYSYSGGSLMGCSYVVFGGPGVGSGGVFSLSGLTGTNGFKLNGENNRDYSAQSVSMAGDINGDGYADLIIGAYQYLGGSAKGRSYVVFGGPGVGSGGVLSLSSLTGTNGFKLDGENNGDYSGYPVNSAGDINGDGYADLIIGAYGYPGGNGPGRSYVVFGGPGVGSGGDIALSSLTGANGFKLDGENNGDHSGYSINAAGDINGDGHDDLIIGADAYLGGSNKGRSYVVFGGSEVGNSGIFNLSSLTGGNGFKLNGENNSEDSGISVSAAGDINGDGHADLIIGADAYPKGNAAGCSYVVFGGLGVGSGGVFNLSSVTGANGFKLDGENNGDHSGWPVSTAGDINGDGVADLLIGAYGHANSTGRSYVVFGDIPPVLVQNHLTLQSGSIVPFNSTYLSAYDLNHDNSTLVFIPSDVTHGEFELVSQPGVSLSNFTQPQLLNDSIQFVHDGSSFAPSYNITVYSAGIAWTGPSPANITFIPVTTGTPTITPSSTVTTTPLISTSVPTSTPTPSLTVTPTSTPIVTTPTQTTPTSTSVTPTPTLTPATSTATPITSTLTPVSTTTPVASTPTPIVPTLTPTPTVASAPVLINNQLTLSNGETVVLFPDILQASEAGFDDNQLLFTVGDVQNGYFTFLPFNTSRPTQWKQAQIQNGVVSFVHAGNQQAPCYQMSVSDGVRSTAPSLAAVNFLGAPVITQNSLNVSQGGATVLTPATLNVTGSDLTPTEITFQVSDTQHAQFVSTQTGLPVSTFTLTALQTGLIEVIQDGSSIAPSYTIQATGSGGQSSAPSLVTTQFSNQQGVFAPRMALNTLFVTQGQPTILGLPNIQASQENGQPVADSAVFYLSGVSHGEWTLTDSPGLLISSFSQARLKNATVRFIPDNSRSVPGYQLSVLDPVSGLQSASLPASVFFTPLNQPPQLMSALPEKIVTVGEPFSFTIPFGAFQDPQGEALQYVVSRFNNLTALPGWLQFNSLNQRFTGTPLTPDFIDVNVTAINFAELVTTTDFTLQVSPVAGSSDSTSLQKTIAAAVVSGTIGVLFAVVQICLKRAANQKLRHALGDDQDAYDVQVVRPVAKEIARRLKITGFMNYTTNTEMAHYKAAVRTLLSALDQRGVNLKLADMKDVQRDTLINTIARETQRYFIPKPRCCTNTLAFFKAQLTPRQLEEAAPAIAAAVVKALDIQPAERETSPFSAPGRGSQLFVEPRPVASPSRGDENEDKQASEIELESPATGLTKRSPPPLSPSSLSLMD